MAEDGCVSMSQRQDLMEELDELRRKAQMEKTRLVEVKTKGTDTLQSYSREMPNELAMARDFWFDLLVWSIEEPAEPHLAIAAILGIYSVEGVMSRWLALAEVLHDREREADYRAISSRDPQLRDVFTQVDTNDMVAENE